MDVDMLQMAADALGTIAEPHRMMFLVLGVLIGLALGVIPGLGGLVGLSLLLPFTYQMDPFTAFALLIGLQAVTATSDTIPAILFGVPGTIGSAATTLDGYPMARRGEAGRALGAAFTSCVLGGLFGAVLLGISIPVLRPVMLFISSPELLAICIFGLSLVAVLSGSAPFKGLAAACAGLLLAGVGLDSQMGTPRWVFGTTYLWEGVPVVPLALGLFALPELADLAIARSSIARSNGTASRWQQLQGVRDVLRERFLLLRSATIGAGLGSVPGIGSAVIDWIAYGHAVRTCRNPETFGTGDVRGVIASESSNNAKEGGALIPTIAFGVPGSASMALLLGAFLIQGLVPGPEMLTSRLDVTYSLVWSLAIANLIGGAICFLFADQLAKVATVRVGILVPVVVAITYIGAYQGSNQWGDLYALLAFGVLGWVMKRLRWSRPPLVLGFVLGDLIERYMFISVERYGAGWLSRPLVIVVLAVTLYSILAPGIRALLRRRREGGVKAVFGFHRAGIGPDLVFTAAMFVLFAATLVASAGWPFSSRLVPQTVAVAGMVFSLWLLLSAVLIVPAPAPAGEGGAAKRDVHIDLTSDFSHLGRRAIGGRAAVYFAWCLFFLGAAKLIGLLPAMLLFLLGSLRLVGRESWTMTLAIAGLMTVFCYVLFHLVLAIPWPIAYLGNLFPALRSVHEFNIL